MPGLTKVDSVICQQQGHHIPMAILTCKKERSGPLAVEDIDSHLGMLKQELNHVQVTEETGTV